MANFNTTEPKMGYVYDESSDTWYPLMGLPLDAPSVNEQTSTSYTLTSSDLNRTITLDNALAIDVFVPGGIFPSGTRIHLIQTGLGQVEVKAGSGVSVTGNPGTKISKRYGLVTLTAITTDTFIVTGDVAS